MTDIFSSQLESKLRGGSISERKDAIDSLVQGFSENSSLIEEYTTLWKLFIENFRNKSVTLRVKCIECSIKLLKHQNMRDSIIDALKNQSYDTNIVIRHALSMAIIEMAKLDFRMVSGSADMMKIVYEQIADEQFIIREKALATLAIIYVQCSMYVVKKEIAEKILHIYRTENLNIRLYIEQLFVVCFVNYRLPTKDRMNALCELACSIDDNGMDALMVMQTHQSKLRKSVSIWIKLHHVKEHTLKIQNQMDFLCHSISKDLPTPTQSQEFLQKFSLNLRENKYLLREMDTILRFDATCNECSENKDSVLHKLGYPIPTNLYYKTIKILLDRISNVLVDRAAIEVLLNLIEDFVVDGMTVGDAFPPQLAEKRGLQLLEMLSKLFPQHFHYDSILRKMINFLSLDKKYVSLHIFKAYTNIGRYHPLIKSHAHFLAELAPICQQSIISGTPKEAKCAIQCMHINAHHSVEPSISDNLNIFPNVIESIKTMLPNNRTAIVALGHIAYNMPHFNDQIEKMFSKKIVRGMLLKDSGNNVGTQPLGDWCDEELLPESTRLKIEAFKAMARWLIGLKDKSSVLQKTFRLLSSYIKQKGDLLQSRNLSQAEMSWLRLSAGKAMLKICQQKDVGGQYSTEQFYMLSTLMIDPVMEVRELFAKKLHKGLSKGIPNNCLPLDFMSFYALGGRETELKLQAQIKTYIETDVNSRREYLKTYTSVEKAMVELSHISPDYILVFAVPILTHDPNFTSVSDPVQLKQIEKCLWLILEPLITNRESFCFGFYKNLIQRMKNHRDAYKPHDSTVNHKLYVICDLAMHIIFTKSSNRDERDISLDARIPSMYYQAQPESYQNIQNYIPEAYLPHNSTTTNGTKKTDIVVRATRKVLRSDTEGATTSTVSSQSPPSPARTIQDPNQSANANSTNPSAKNMEDKEKTNDKEPIVRTQPKQTNQTDENTEPPAKRLRTRTTTASSNHQ